MNHHTPEYREVDGEILPVYEGVNGPIASSGRQLSSSEASTFIQDSEPVSRVEAKPTLSERAFLMAERAGAEALASEPEGLSVEAKNETLGKRLQMLQDERDADRAGTYLGSSPSDHYSRAKPTEDLTSAKKNKNAEKHRRQAYRDRWGK